MDENAPIPDLHLETRPHGALNGLGTKTIGGFWPGSVEGNNDSEENWNAIFNQLSVRVQHGLETLEIDTLGAFLALTQEKFMLVRSMGLTSWNEVYRHQKQLRNVVSGTNAFSEDTANRNNSSLGQLSETTKKFDADWDTVFNQLSVRVQHGLETLEIDTLDDFLALTREKFLSLRAMGATSWNEVHRHQKRLHNAAPITDESSAGTAGRVASSTLSRQDNKDLLSAVRKELGTRQHILDDLRIHSFSQLLTINYEEVTALKHVGQRTWQKLQEAIHKASTIAKSIGIVLSPEEIKLTDFPLFDGAGIGSNPIPETFYPNAPTDSLALSSRVLSTLKKLHLNSLKNILTTDSERLLRQNNFGENSLVKLRESILDYLQYRNNSDDLSIDTCKSFTDFLKKLCQLSGQSKKTTNIFIGRLGGFSGEKETYEALAREQGCSKERVRQILKTTLDAINQNYRSRGILKSFQNTARNILEDSRGIIDLDSLSKQISHRLRWNETISVESLRELFNSFSFIDEIETKDDLALCKHPCRSCHSIVERTCELMRSSEFQILPFDNFFESSSLCKPSSDKECPLNCGMKYSRAFLYELASRAGFYYDKDNAYSDIAWTLMCGSIPQKTEAVLEMLGRPVVPGEVWEAMCPYLDEFVPPEKIHSTLIHVDNAYVWGRGEFIHKNHIHIHIDMLSQIRATLLARLANNSFVALSGVFRELRVPCEKAGIPNDYALSTVVSLYLTEFHTDRYRYVHANKISKTASIDPYIEQWLLKQGGEAKRSELEQWMVEQVGVRKSLVGLSLSRLNNVFLARNGYLIHVDNTDLDVEKLAPFYRQAKFALERHEYISVGLLFREQRVICYQLGITSTRMLYAAMQYFFSAVLDFPRYPHICQQDQKSLNSLDELISAYVREKNTIVSVDDCIHSFEAKGYSPVQLRNRLSNITQVLPFYPGCVVHSDTIGWDADKISKLRDVLFKVYTSCLDTGHLIGDLEEVCDHYETKLPTLSAGLSWTLDLLAALAAKCDDVVFLGNAKRAYVMAGRENSINTLADLVVTIVRDHFGGGCSREQMNQWMQENGVVRKQLATHMFTAPPGLEITDYEYLWKGGIYA